MRPLGQTGVRVSILGLGGGGTGQNPQIRGAKHSPGIRRLAVQIVEKALDLGINYFDTCTGYGESESILGEVAQFRRKEMFLATKCQSPSAPGETLRRELEQSLTRLQSSQIDLWQIHNLATDKDIETIFLPNRAIEVFLKAQEEGLVRFIGLSGHTSARVLEAAMDRCIREGISMDTLLFSFSSLELWSGGHARRLLNRYPGTAKVAMKIFGGDGAPVLRSQRITAAEALRYVLSHDFSTAIVGMHQLAEIEENARVAREFQPLEAAERMFIEMRPPEGKHHYFLMFS